MQLRYLDSFGLYKATKTKQTNGSYIDTLSLTDNYYCQSQELDDEISASIYGAKLDKMSRISSIRSELENYLQEKLDEASDYIIVSANRKYKIVSVKKKWVDIELIGNYNGQVSV